MNASEKWEVLGEKLARKATFTEDRWGNASWARLKGMVKHEGSSRPVWIGKSFVFKMWGYDQTRKEIETLKEVGGKSFEIFSGDADDSIELYFPKLLAHGENERGEWCLCERVIEVPGRCLPYNYKQSIRARFHVGDLHEGNVFCIGEGRFALVDCGTAWQEEARRKRHPEAGGPDMSDTDRGTLRDPFPPVYDTKPKPKDRWKIVQKDHPNGDMYEIQDQTGTRIGQIRLTMDATALVNGEVKIVSS